MKLDKTLSSNCTDFHIPEEHRKLENNPDDSSYLRDKLQELVPLIDKKLGYRVDFYPLSFSGEIVLGVAPFGSLLMTALVGWDSYHQRYEVKSPRVQREKHVHDMQIFRGHWVNNVLVSKSRSKIVNTVCGFRSYLDEEVYLANVRKSREEATEACGATAKEFKALEARWSWNFGNKEATELLRLLERSQKTGSPIAFELNSPIMEMFSAHKTKEAQLEEKLNYVGKLTPVYLVKQKADSDQVALIICSDEQKRTVVLDYPNVQALPQEMQNKLFTLSTVVDDGHRMNTNTVDGVGAKIKPILCEEACWLAVSDDLVEELITDGYDIYADL